MLYSRQIIVMLLQLISVRLLLNVLGVEDYGIYNVVSGIVLLLSFLTGAMASATQRFFSFALGKQDNVLLNKMFGTNLAVYSAIAVISLLLFESAGLWFVHNRLNIAPEKIETVKILYQFSILSFFASMISSPYIAIMIAHEEMNIYAGISILEAFLKIGSVFLLFVLPYNKLFLYGLLMTFSAALIAGLYCAVCTIRYKECSIRKCRFEWSFLKEIIDFTGWSLFGALSTVIRFQAITILINQFFSPVTVAARTVALSVSSSLNSFTSNFSTGLYPPIVKTWAAGEKEEMYQLVYTGCKITFFLNWIFTLPCLLEIDVILKLWLKNPPSDAGLFTRLALMETIVLSVSWPLMTAARAAGNMRKYELPLGIIQILILPVSWGILLLGGAAWTTLAVAIFANIAMFFVRLIVVAQMTALPMQTFFSKTLKPVSNTVASSLILLLTVRYFLPDTLLMSGIFFLGSFILIASAIFYCGLLKEEREKIISIIRNRFHRILNHKENIT